MNLTQTKYTPKQHVYVTVEELYNLPLRDVVIFDTFSQDYICIIAGVLTNVN